MGNSTRQTGRVHAAHPVSLACAGHNAYRWAMARQYDFRPARALRIHCPVAEPVLARLLAGDRQALEDDPALAAMLAIVRGDNPLGDFGLYRGVMELAPGWELFTPTATARPTAGAADENAVSSTVILTVHLPHDAPQDRIDAAIGAILRAHPWEVPVIELTETRLVTRAPKAG